VILAYTRITNASYDDEADMKVNNNSNPAIRKKQSTKASNNPAFQSLLTAEMGAIDSPPNIGNEHPHSQKEPSPEQSFALLGHATDLLDEALSLLSHGESPSQETIASIEKVRSELNLLSINAPHEKAFNDAEILLAVEAKRLAAMRA